MGSIGTSSVRIGILRFEIMLRITKISDYGVVVLACFARHSGSSVLSAMAIAESTGLPAPTVSKILKVLAHGGLVRSYRGPQGGYELSRPPEDISLVEAIEVIEGPLAVTECSGTVADNCEHEYCELRGYWPRVNTILRGALASISIAQISGTEPIESDEPPADPVSALELGR
jgi:FeS assembly SUF system regulator